MEAGGNVGDGVGSVELHRAGAAADIEVAVRRTFRSLPFEEYGFRASPATHQANRFAINNLRSWIDAGAGTIAKADPHHLGKVVHELVVVFELVLVDTEHAAIVGYADQQIAALSVQECGDRFQNGVGDSTIFAVLLQVPAQGGFELQRYRFLLLQQLIGLSVTSQVLV